ncbi:hypothetical protein BSKO_02803 [Bryopsis sp. KO-2023]|nr:hypothetical protein BSKO_02803 [Bryopsis sp. KO-2023]
MQWTRGVSKRFEASQTPLCGSKVTKLRKGKDSQEIVAAERMSDLVSVTRRPFTVEWDLPEGVLCQIFDLLPIKRLGRCCSVKKSWSDLISETHDLKLERAWRMGAIEPKRSNFDMPNQTIMRSAKQGDMIAVGVLSDSIVNGIAIMDLRNDVTFFRNNIDCNGVLRFVDGMLVSGDQESGVVRVWDVPTLTEKVSFKVSEEFVHVEDNGEKASFKVPVGIVDVADVGEYFAVCGSFGYLGFWKKEDFSESQVLQIREKITSFTYFEGLLYFGLGGGGISFWRLKNADCVVQLEAHANFVDTLVVNERVIASCAIDVSTVGGHIKVMERERGEVLQAIHFEDFYSPQSFGIGHSKFACQVSMNKVELWDIDEDCCFRTIYFDDRFIGAHVIGIYLTVDKLTVVDSKGDVLQFDFASIEY